MDARVTWVRMMVERLGQTFSECDSGKRGSHQGVAGGEKKFLVPAYSFFSGLPPEEGGGGVQKKIRAKNCPDSKT